MPSLAGITSHRSPVHVHVMLCYVTAAWRATAHVPGVHVCMCGFWLWVPVPMQLSDAPAAPFQPCGRRAAARNIRPENRRSMCMCGMSTVAVSSD